jgi:hypothetical protein
MRESREGSEIHAVPCADEASWFGKQLVWMSNWRGCCTSRQLRPPQSVSTSECGVSTTFQSCQKRSKGPVSFAMGPVTWRMSVKEALMSCMMKRGLGGTPEIFPISAADMLSLQNSAREQMAPLVAGESPVFVGTALKPDGTPFYLCTMVPDSARAGSTQWKGAFFAPFGVGDVIGSVEGYPNVASISVKARLMARSDELVSAEWEVIGTVADTVNNSALIRSIRVINAGPHDSGDVRRCIALHAPQCVFGEAVAVVAMQCGVAAACLIEAIC